MKDRFEINYLTMIPSKNYLQKLNANQILDLSKFVVSENFKHHTGNFSSQEYEDDVHSIYNEESSFYKNSQIFVAKDPLGFIKGSIRVLHWNYIDTLPIEKIFGINPSLVSSTTKANNIYHIGRFAIKKDVRDINLFKKLMVCAITPICNDESNVAFAECDSKLLRILSLLGIKTKVIGKSIDYLGSETIPVSMDYEGLINFYNTNKYLVTDDVNTNTLDNKISFSIPGNLEFKVEKQKASISM